MLSKIIEKIADNIKELPDKTELSLVVVINGKADYDGRIKRNGGIEKIDNYTSAFEIGSVTKAFTGNIMAQMVILSSFPVAR
jgi:CubicO group peptidase (beta-lactamase class C family)